MWACLLEFGDRIDHINGMLIWMQSLQVTIEDNVLWWEVKLVAKKTTPLKRSCIRIFSERSLVRPLRCSSSPWSFSLTYAEKLGKKEFG